MFNHVSEHWTKKPENLFSRRKKYIAAQFLYPPDKIFRFCGRDLSWAQNQK